MPIEENQTPKGFGPQRFAGGEPSSEWGVEELGVYAQVQYRHILDGERLQTPAYWRLGKALTLAKKAFGHGQWQHYLEELGIDKTRASKARAIFQSFDDEIELKNLTVEEAYACRSRRGGQAPATDTSGVSKKEAEKLRRSIGMISKRSAEVSHEAAFADAAEAATLIPKVRQAIEELQSLLLYLEEQASVADDSRDNQ